MSVLKAAIHEVADRGRKVIDKRTKLGRELMRWRGELVADLGGAEQPSTRQQALVDISMRTSYSWTPSTTGYFANPASSTSAAGNSTRRCSSAQR
jgi:hypothetical protein